VSKFNNFLIKIGVNTTAVDVVGGRLVGWLSVLNAENAGGYLNPNVIDGYSLNPSDGNWYKPSLFDGKFDFSSPASPEIRENLNQQRYWREVQNKIENVGPANGQPGELNSPSLWKLLKQLPQIVDRYREISPDIWRELQDYAVPNGLNLNGINYDINGNVISGLITSLQNQFSQAEQTISPLILDLDGQNGAETLSKTAGIHFDHDGNKFAEQTGWVGQNDGLLVWDKNGNNQIDNGAELFGNNTVLNNGHKAANGFFALAELDSNQDGKVDANDAASSQLRVFKDANSNGVVDAGELLTLAEAGVQSLSTGYTTQAVTDANGNRHLQAGSFITTAGQRRAMDDVWFSVDTARSIDTDLVAVNSTIAALPDIEGFGNVHSLHQAMALDPSGKLQGLVQSFQSATDEAERVKLFDQILWTWTGADRYAATSRGPNVDARKLYAVEAFIGRGFVQGAGSDGGAANFPGPNAGAQLTQAYALLGEAFYDQLMSQTVYRSLYEGIGLSWNADSQSFDWDVSTVVATLRAQYDANPEQGLALMAGFGENLKSMEEAGRQVLAKLRQQGNVQSQGFDLCLTILGGNLLAGTAGKDTLNAKAGVDNLFSAGKGADVLNGGSGSDSYIWSKGDGNDTINEVDGAGSIDTLQFLDVSASEVRLSRWAGDLYITIGAEQIKVAGHFGSTSAALGQVQFSDGSIWQKSVLDAAPALYLGTRGNDTLWGTSLVDVFESGKGADILYGGTGSDTYTWLKGDGNDTINDVGAVTDVDTLKLADVKAADVQLSRDTANLYVTIGSEKITIKDHFAAGYSSASIELILFADGGKWQKADLDLAPYRGTAAKNTIYGTAQAEIFIGGAEADTLIGGAGGDTYSWSRGDGNDTVNDVGAAEDIDTLLLVDVNAADAQLSRDMVNLYVTIGSEKITIKDYFATGYSAAPIEQVQFADDVKWQKTDLDAALYRGGGSGDTIYGTASAEGFLGGKGADTLYGGAGGDTYVWQKGDGNDTINDVGTVTDVDALKLTDAKAVDVRLSRDTTNLYVTIGSEKITIKDHFAVGYLSAPIEQIQFADGAKWQKADLDAAPYRGTAAKNTIYGTAQAEIFIGGTEADTLYGGFGGDTYTWLKGDGNDTINDLGAAADVDTLRLVDVNAADAQLSRDTVNLYVTIGAEKITIKDHFAVGYLSAPIEQIVFADGGKWQKADLDAALYRGGASNDTIYGTSAAEGFLGGKGADTLYGGFGWDTYTWLNGDGNDTVNDVGAATDIDTLKLADAKAADVQLSRDTTNLYITIGSEKITIKDHFATGYSSAPIEQILFADGGKWQKADLDLAPYRGTVAKNTIYGTAQAETFIGGAEADTLLGGAGSDTYKWSKGDGNDTINDVGAAADIDTLMLVDVKAVDEQLSRDTVNLYVSIGTEKVTIKDHFAMGYSSAPIEQIVFADGGKWQKADLDLAPYRGTTAKDTIYGTAQAEVFIGGAGADTLLGGVGNDTYQLARGDGVDTLQENDTTAGNADMLQFMAGINFDQLWFRKASNNLEVSVIGTADKAVVKDWYLGNPYHVEQIKAGDGKLLLDTQVQQLVQAMAAFAPPPMGQTTLTAAQQTALAPVLAANWQ
jgi:Ca2+-binding RTX toxin-like protein